MTTDNGRGKVGTMTVTESGDVSAAIETIVRQSAMEFETFDPGDATDTTVTVARGPGPAKAVRTSINMDVDVTTAMAQGRGTVKIPTLGSDLRGCTISTSVTAPDPEALEMVCLETEWWRGPLSL